MTSSRALGLVGACAVLSLTGCAAPTGESETAVISKLGFAREEPDGVSTGFDLDGLTSDETDAGGCFIEDFTSPDGALGIDNSFAKMLPALDLAGGSALSDLIQAAVDSGELLLMLELSGIDDFENDVCVALDLSRGSGSPSLGTDGAILPDQTYDRDLDQPATGIECATITDQVLSAEGVSVRLPLQIFDESIDLTMTGGIIELRWDEDGGYSGQLAGGVSVQEIQDNVDTLDGIGNDIPVLIETVLETRADLKPDSFGICQEVAVTFEYLAVGAYFFDPHE